MNILIGISGGIAAIKVPELVQILRDRGHSVQIVMTKHATQIISQKLFTDKNILVHTSLFPQGYSTDATLQARSIEHISLASWADILAVVPATANCISKTSLGLADDLLSTLILACDKPILLFPSMNTHMWTNPVIQSHRTNLLLRDINIIDPVSGSLACGTDGIGRLPDIETIVAKIENKYTFTQSLKHVSILITAGSTKEPIDSVRYISNRSSGKMGKALARACASRGASVTLITNTLDPTLSPLVKQIAYTSYTELETLLRKYSTTQKLIIHTAAVTDFSTSALQGKYPGNIDLTLQLKPQKKLITQIKRWSPDSILVGFKAAHGLDNISRIVKEEYINKSLVDLIVVNDISRDDIGFESDNNEVILYAQSGEIGKLAKKTKSEIALEIINELMRFFPSVFK